MIVIKRIDLFCPLLAEGIESYPGPQTGSTRGNSSLGGSQRGRGCSCNGRGSGRGSGQDPIKDAFVESSVCEPAGLRPAHYLTSMHPDHKINRQLVLNRQ